MFPSGTSIAASGYLIATRDRVDFLEDYGSYVDAAIVPTAESTTGSAVYIKDNYTFSLLDASGTEIDITSSTVSWNSAVFEKTAPITTASKQYKYTGTDPSLIMMIIDIKTGGKVQQFIAKEIAAKFGAIYCWDNQGCGIPKCGAGSSFTSRSLLKIGTAVLQGGKFNGKQLLSADYVKLIMDRKKGDGYFYYFHNVFFSGTNVIIIPY